jgi:hypothetical protein
MARTLSARGYNRRYADAHDDDHHAAEHRTTKHDRANALDKYRGFNFGAAFFGWLVATAIGVLLTSIVAAAGASIALTATKNAAQDATTIGIVGAAALLIVLAIAYYAGGYVAGRMSRFDGGRQGLGVWIMGLVVTLVIAALGAIFGSQYNVLQQLNMPAIPVDGSDLTSGGVITLLVVLVVTALAAIAGGKTGRHYHNKIDDAL